MKTMLCNERNDKHDHKVHQSHQDSPDEFFGALYLSCEKSAHKTGNNIDNTDSDGDCSTL